MERATTKPEGQGKKRRRLRVRPAYILLLGLMAFFAFKFIERTREIHQLQDQQAALRYDNHMTAAENASLQRELQYEKTLSYVGAAARSSLGYIAPGENAVQVQPQYRRVVAVRKAPPPPPAPPQPTWKQWWKAFFG